MKIHITILMFILLTGCQKNKNNAIQEDTDFSFFVGTYTDAESQGIYKYSLRKDGVLKRIGLVAKTENPSFLAMSTDKKFLVSVNEINRENEGGIESYLIKSDSLEFISRSTTGGAHPCFVSVNEDGFVLTANYTGGNVGLLRLNINGELSPLLDVQQHIGKGTTERQDAPHAHSVWFESNDNKIISVDLGTNELWFSQLDTETQKLIPSEPNKLSMHPGAGPRHLMFHPNGKWMYVLNELDNTVTLVERSNNGKYIKGGSISTLPVGFTEPSKSADIHISSKGKFLYASNRGHNSIVIYEVNADNGSLNLIGHQSTEGDGPRNFALSPDEDYLLVANQHTNNIVSFKRDKITGLLSSVSQIDAPSPVYILF